MTSLERAQQFASAYRRTNDQKVRTTLGKDFFKRGSFRLEMSTTSANAGPENPVGVLWNELWISGAFEILIEIMTICPAPHDSSRARLSLYIGAIAAINDLLRTAEYTYWDEKRSATRIKAALPNMILKLKYTLLETKKSPERPLFMLAYQPCLRAISTIYTRFSTDTKLVASCPIDTMIDLAYTALFDPSFEDEEVKRTAWSLFCAEVLIYPSGSYLGSDKKVASKVIAEFDPQRVASRCRYFFEHPKLRVGAAFWGASLIVFSLTQYGEIQAHLASNGSVYTSMMKAIWDWRTDQKGETPRETISANEVRIDETVSRAAIIRRTLLFLCRVCDTIALPLRNRLVNELVRQGSLVLMIAHSLGPEAGKTTTSVSQEMLCRSIQEASLTHLDLMDDFIIPEWSHAEESFLFLERSSKSIGITPGEVWRGYGARFLGLARVHGEPAFATPTGCSWLKCLLYGDAGDEGPKLVLCTACLGVQYCSEVCQRRDWLEGGHKKLCQGVRLGIF